MGVVEMVWAGVSRIWGENANKGGEGAALLWSGE